MSVNITYNVEENILLEKTYCGKIRLISKGENEWERRMEEERRRSDQVSATTT